MKDYIEEVEVFDSMEEVKDPPASVYIRVNENNEVVEVNSDRFITDFTGWIKIDEGYGDKYSHAQGNYLDEPIFDENGMFNYRYENNKIVKIEHGDMTELFRKNELRCIRTGILKAFDIYKTNVEYGIETETETEHSEYIAWYQGLLELEESSVLKVPERIKRYMK